ncbi:MAG: hypothetical protein A4E64_03042 [Syntrophorhabdus sp. PtaU1.Bin058]|nr:MAG: hypothetical protein A4E64_03042 [Syntrophorhabdus sp. PtaU1.Bin058]
MKVFFAILPVLTMVFGYAGFTYADCPDWHGYCYTDQIGGSLLGSVTVGQCWKWRELSCDFCRGSKEPDEYCNNEYPQCKGRCWAFNGIQGDDGVSCWDKDGNCHGPWCGDNAARSALH